MDQELTSSALKSLKLAMRGIGLIKQNIMKDNKDDALVDLSILGFLLLVVMITIEESTKEPRDLTHNETSQ